MSETMYVLVWRLYDPKHEAFHWLDGFDTQEEAEDFRDRYRLPARWIAQPSALVEYDQPQESST